MKTRVLAEVDGLRTYVIVMDKGEDPIAALTAWADENGLGGMGLTGVGAFRRATLGYFDAERKDYRGSPVEDQAEVLSFIGDIAETGEGHAVHVHAVLGLRDTSTRGGHLLAAEVWPTLELIATQTPTHLRKRLDPETGLALIDPSLGT